MAVQIAQLVVPSDGIGNPDFMVPDWDRGRIFFVNHTGLRAYNVALTTQSPAVSVTVSNPFTNICYHDTDPVTGALMVAQASGVVNKYDPTTLTQTGTYNAGTNIEGVICCGCGTLASGGAVQRGYALIKRSIFSGVVDVIFSDTMTTAGASLNVVSGDIDNRGILWRGKTGATGATVFAMGGDYSGPQSSYPIWAIDIVPGAETYTSSNPDITVRTVGNVTATAIDPTWTDFAVNSHGYDQSDGNILLDVSTFDSVATQHYVIKVSGTTAAVIWATAVAPHGDVLEYSHVSRRTLGLLPSGQFAALSTGGGFLGTATLAGLSFYSDVLSDDASGLIALACTYASGTNAPTPVSGTPSSFTGYALIGGLLIPPDFPLSGVVKVLLPPAELQFCDAQGIPYAGGTLTMYAQGTSTPKDTWQDPAGTILNTNPIVLDSSGRALIYGDGGYRTVLHDADGNLIWDQPSFTYISACMVPVVGAATLADAREAMGITDAIEAEAEARTAAIGAEQTRAETEEASLQSQITAEIARAEAAEAHLQSEIDAIPPPASTGNVIAGSATCDSSGHCRVTFPSPFSTSCTAVSVTPLAVGGWPYHMDAGNITKAGFDTWAVYAGTRTVVPNLVFCWMATGS